MLFHIFYFKKKIKAVKEKKNDYIPPERCSFNETNQAEQINTQ